MLGVTVVKRIDVQDIVKFSSTAAKPWVTLASSPCALAPEARPLAIAGADLRGCPLSAHHG